MGVWNLIRRKKQADRPEIPPNFDYKAGYIRAIKQLDVVNRNLIGAVEALKLAADMTENLRVHEAKAVEVEAVSGPLDGAGGRALLITQECLDTFQIAENTFKHVISCIQESMHEVGREELEVRLANPQTNDFERRMLLRIKKEMDAFDAAKAKVKS